MGYDELDFKVPAQCRDYDDCSAFVTGSIESIMKQAISADRNKIIINTNLKLGLPMENINKVAVHSLKHGQSRCSRMFLRTQTIVTA